MSDRHLRHQVIRLAAAHPELRKDLLPLVTKKATDTLTITPSTSGEETMTAFLSEAANMAFPRAVDSVRYVSHNVFSVQISESDFQHGETSYRDFEFLLNVRMGKIVVTSEGKERAKFPLDVWSSTVMDVSRVMKRLGSRIPTPGRYHEDTPSLQDTAPAEYFTERSASVALVPGQFYVWSQAGGGKLSAHRGPFDSFDEASANLPPGWGKRVVVGIYKGQGSKGVQLYDSSGNPGSWIPEQDIVP